MDPRALTRDFESALLTLGRKLNNRLDFSSWPAPHKPIGPPKGASNVYVFYLGMPDAPKRVLKVGKAGPKSAPRYHNHHYNFSAPSTLAKAILHNPILWPDLGIGKITKEEVGDWIKRNTTRLNFHLSPDDGNMLPLLEVFLRGRLSPMMEGVQMKEAVE